MNQLRNDLRAVLRVGSTSVYRHVVILVLGVTQTRNGDFYPTILDIYQRNEKALVLAIAEVYIQGVSTRWAKMIIEEFLGREFSSMAISRFSASFNVELDTWRERTFM